MSGENENANREDIHSKVVRAGKRTYFFDVKSTRGNDLYLTITESKRRYLDDGKFSYEKHKLFLYKEDFDKFSEGLTESIEKIAELRADESSIYSQTENDHSSDHKAKAEENVSAEVEEVKESTSENGMATQVDQSEDQSSESDDKDKFTSVSFDDLGDEAGSDEDKQA